MKARPSRTIAHGATETAGAFDREPALRPLRAPVQQPIEGPGVVDEPPLTNFVACRIDSDCGVRGLVGIDPDDDHAHSDLAADGRNVRGHSDLK